MNPFFKEKYDVIIIGGALSGLSSALKLLENGKDVLVLEQHNIPGGVATSYIRGGTEIEASLHEFDAVGTKEFPLENRLFFEHYGIDVEWVRLPHAYRFVDNEISVSIPCGENGDYSKPAKVIADACGDKDGSILKKINQFFEVCLHVYKSMGEIPKKKISKIKLIIEHSDFVKTIGYTYEEVMRSFDLPQKAMDILNAYWIYLGSPSKDMPFTINAYVLADILFFGGYIPRHTSYEMSIKMMDKVLEMGGQVELKQRVDKILVKDNHVRGVRLANGTVINADYVICGAYPNVAYQMMIEPQNEVPKKAIKLINSMEIGVVPFIVNLLLDKDYEELNMHDYAIFNVPNGLNSDKIFEDSKGINDWGYYTSICMNAAIPDASKPGTTLYTIAHLPRIESFNNIDVKQYSKIKDEITNYYLDAESKRLGVNLREHIIEIIVETPYTISRYCSSPFGAIYGYRHTMKNHPIARFMMKDKERYIKGLSFNGACQVIGDGMGPAIINGTISADEILSDMKREKR